MYRFSGSQNTTVGADYQAVLGNANFFGEAARSANGGFSMINGLVAALHPSLTFSAVWRYFGKDFQNTKANVFGENSLTAANERGLYTGVQANLSSKITLTAYADLVRYPWLRYRVDGPSVATDYLAQLNYKPDKKNEIYLRYRRRENVLNSSFEDAIITAPAATLQENWRINGSYQVHPNVQLRSRAEWSLFTTWLASHLHAALRHHGLPRLECPYLRIRKRCTVCIQHPSLHRQRLTCLWSGPMGCGPWS